MSIKFENVSFIYNKKSKLENTALKDISFEMPDKFFCALVGKTGSGKSTLIQQINGLLFPTSGKVIVDDFVISENKKERTKKLNNLRKNVGYLFQFSESQLFEETVLRDVMFAPLNFGYSEEEAKNLAIHALNDVQLDESFYERSPIELSGGEKRRVALAGIIATQPKYLILDEPTAGLDQKGIDNILNLLVNIYKNGTNIILVTHDMEIVYKYADLLMILDDGKLKYFGDVDEGFKHLDEVYLPPIYLLKEELKKNNLDLNYSKIKDVDSLIYELKKEK